MKIIAVSGSPRRGNTEWMLKTVMEEAARKGADTELILLRRQHIRRCTGCLACEGEGGERPGTCQIQDDMTAIYPRLRAADAIVLGTPVYFEMLSGLLKDFLDRTCPIWTMMPGKPIAGVAVAEAGIGKAVQNMKTYAALCRMRWAGQVTALAKTPGAVAADPRVAARLKRLARLLVSL
jgi:multimeric flavodoxin WrbA